MLSALVRRRLLSLTPQRASCLLLSARPSSCHPPAMLGPRTRSGSRDEPQRMATSSSGKEAAAARDSSGTEVEMTNLQHSAHKTVSERSSSLEKSMRSELGKAGGALEVSQQLPASKSSMPAFPLLGVGACAACSLLLLWGFNPAVHLDRLWTSYLTALANAPLITKMCTAGACTLIGDTLAQVLPFLLKSSGQKSKHDGSSSSSSMKEAEASSGQDSSSGALQGFRYDPARAARFLMFSVLLATPIAHEWFAFLDKFILPSAPFSPTAVVLKMASDQFFMTPMMTCIFFAFMTSLEGYPDKAWSVVKSKIKPTLKANYMLWPAAHLINFGFVPLDLRILYINVVAIGWTVYLSSQAANKNA